MRRLSELETLEARKLSIEEEVGLLSSAESQLQDFRGKVTDLACLAS